jgi:hypothetical protein
MGGNWIAGTRKGVRAAYSAAARTAGNLEESVDLMVLRTA